MLQVLTLKLFDTGNAKALHYQSYKMCESQGISMVDGYNETVENNCIC